MGLEEEINALQSALSNTLHLLVEAETRTSCLLDYSFSEIDNQIPYILEDCEAGLSNLKASLAQIELIQEMIGKSLSSSYQASFASSVSNSSSLPKMQPNLAEQIAKTTAENLEVQDGGHSLEKHSPCLSNIDTVSDDQSFLATVVQVALMVNAVTNPGDSWINRNLITSLIGVRADESCFDGRAALKKLSRVWVTTALGDQGELAVFKMLIDPDGEDPLTEQELEQIEIKPSLPHRFLNDSQKPDFYINSRKLVCDAKAWRQVTVDKNISSLKKILEKYANLECLSAGGEIRFYFPYDTYNTQENRFKILQSELQLKYNSVKFKMLPMVVDISRLEQQRKQFYNYMKYFMMSL